MKLKLLSNASLVLSLLAVMSLSACDVDNSSLAESMQSNQSDSKTVDSEEWIDISDKGFSDFNFNNRPTSGISFEGRIEAIKAAEVNRSARDAVEDISQSFEIDQARLAANSRDKCPKLIGLKVDSNTIERKGDILKEDYCDYYIYPNKGQSISVVSEPDSTSAYLVSPVIHDFDNGSYIVEGYDKHVIRVDRSDIGYRASPINYNFMVTIN